jgi:hypothetical protein
MPTCTSLSPLFTYNPPPVHFLIFVYENESEQSVNIIKSCTSLLGLGVLTKYSFPGLATLSPTSPKMAKTYSKIFFMVHQSRDV